MRTLLPVLSLALALVFPAWPQAATAAVTNAQSAPGPLAVTVSIPPQRYFVEKIGGDAVTVTVMAGKGQDPHSYEPAAAQMEGITRAAVYFAIGVPFETQWLPKFRGLNPGLEVVDLPRAVDRIAGKPDLALRDALPGRGRHGHGREGHNHGLETDDPHIWLSPEAMRRTIPLMTAALAAKRPEMAAVFERRGAELATEISGLNARIQGLFAPIPGEKLFLTFHQGWAYYARNFGLREVSVELDGREPGPKSMALLMDFARANRIRVIVAGAMTGKSAVRAIAGSLGAEIVIADTLAENWPAALLEFSENLASAMAR